MTPRPLVISVVALLAIAGCSSDEEAADTTSVAATAAPTTLDVTAPPVTDAPDTLPGDDDPVPPVVTEPVAVDTTAPPGPAPTEPAVEGPPTIEELLALRRPIVLAHAGGEDVHPHSTPFGYAESVAAGVDMLDFDVQLTADGVLVVHHDDSVDRTTNGSGAVAEMTYDELAELDNAYWFTLECVCTDRAEEDYLYRGIRTGDREPPDGYAPEDFVIPRFRDIVTRFPTMPLNIEIKGNGEAGAEAARALAAELEELDRLDNAVVTSFDDTVNDAFAEAAPGVEISPGLGVASEWVLNQEPLPDGMRILQLPPEFQGIDVLTPAVVTASRDRGYAIWVWPNDRAYENAEGYDLLLNMGMLGLNINDPVVGVAAVEHYMEDEDPIERGHLADEAIAGVEAAIAQGDDLGDCPYGPTDDLIAALPERLPLADGFATEDVEDNGQVFVGGDVDIVYCVLTPDAGGAGPIEEIRVDVAALPDVELATYLPEEFTSDDVPTHYAGVLFGGDLETGCWTDTKIVCGAFWQGEGIFIATVLLGEADQKKPDAVTAARAIVPLVMERLAAFAST
jgi:glycerophosphoryl diester phosphodiesterase